MTRRCAARSTRDRDLLLRSRGALWVKARRRGIISTSSRCPGLRRRRVLVLVDQVGVACHTGERTCFHIPAERGRPGPPASSARREDLPRTRAQPSGRTGDAAALADGETPAACTASWRRSGTFLLESAGTAPRPAVRRGRGTRSGRTPLATLTSGTAGGLAGHPPGRTHGGDRGRAARHGGLLSGGHPATGAPLPPLTGGLVGFLSYDMVRRFERLPEYSADDLHVPELGMVLATDLVVLDHFEGSAVLVANAILPARTTKAAATAAYHQAVGRLDAMTTALSRPTPPMVSTVENPGVGRFVSRTPEVCTPRPSSRQGGDPGRRGVSRSWWRSVRTADRRPTRSTSTACCLHQPARTCICCGLYGFDIVGLAGGAPEGPGRRDGRPARAAHPIAGTRCRGSTPRRTPGSPPSCSPTPRSGPNT